MLGSSLNGYSQGLTFDVNAAPKGNIPGTLYWGIFEDINFGADGGLYAELVKNRSFEFPQSFMGGRCLAM